MFKVFNICQMTLIRWCTYAHGRHAVRRVKRLYSKCMLETSNCKQLLITRIIFEHKYLHSVWQSGIKISYKKSSISWTLLAVLNNFSRKRFTTRSRERISDLSYACNTCMLVTRGQRTSETVDPLQTITRQRHNYKIWFKVKR